MGGDRIPLACEQDVYEWAYDMALDVPIEQGVKRYCHELREGKRAGIRCISEELCQSEVESRFRAGLNSTSSQEALLWTRVAVDDSFGCARYFGGIECVSTAILNAAKAARCGVEAYDRIRHNSRGIPLNGTVAQQAPSPQP